MDADHPDFAELDAIRQAIFARCGGGRVLALALPKIVVDAVDFVIDPVRTARNRISELDNVEKTFVGLKVEHFLRDFLDFPKGIRDLRIGDVDVDIKNTVGKSWMIPPETFSNADPCLLIMAAVDQQFCTMGLMKARLDYLGQPNRDGKRSVLVGSRDHVLWLVERQPLPESRWHRVDMERFRALRKVRGGSRRAALFFLENLGMAFHRSVLQSLLYDQDDYMKRLRGNGGARDLLADENVALLSGTYHSDAIDAFGYPPCASDEFIAVPLTDERRAFLASRGFFERRHPPR